MGYLFHSRGKSPLRYNTPTNRLRCLLRLLHALFRRRAVQPDSDKSQPPSNRNPDTANPDPGAANLPAPRPLVVGKVPDCDLPLLVDVCNEGAAVVDAEVEDTVLIGGLEGDAEDGGVGGLRDGREVEAVEWRQHAELELNVVVRLRDKGSEVVLLPFGDLDLEVLHGVSKSLTGFVD
jgi:hypothetical protein